MDLAISEEHKPVFNQDGKYNLNRLEGEHVIVWPYARGFYPRDLPYHLWALMEKEDAINKVFYERAGDSDEAKKSHGDLIQFVQYFSDPNKIILIAQSLDGEIAGATWFSIELAKFRAYGNVWFRQKYWGKPSREAGWMSLDYMFHNVGVQYIWGHTPWKTAMNYCVAIGFDYVVTLPDFALIEGEAQDIHVLRISKGEFGNGTRTGER